MDLATDGPVAGRIRERRNINEARTIVTNIDEYIGGFPPEVQAILEEMRGILREEAPGAQEAIKYAIPTFVPNGNLVHFAASG